jgi:hypothetical protein
MRLLLLPIKPELWKSPDIAIAMEQARDSARRIRKKIDIRRERVRYSLACERIESLAIQDSNTNGTFFEIEGAQAYTILNLLPTDGDTKFPFCGPSHIKELKANLPREISAKISITGGLVVVLDPFRHQYSQPQSIESIKQKNGTNKPAHDYSSCEVDLDSLNNEAVLRRTHEQIRRAIETGEPMGWVNVESSDLSGTGLARHTIFIKALREYIGLRERPWTKKLVKVPKKVPDEEAISIRENKWWYQLLKKFLPFLLPKSIPMKTIMIDKEEIEYLPIEPIYIRFAYKDGSEGDPFPLFCLPLEKEPPGLPVIQAALISSRHFELDRKVDLCLLRNSEISLREDATIAEQEKIAYDKATKFIQGYIKKFKGLELYLYHTGLEPAIIGTYHAVVETLRLPNFRGRLMVIPKIYHKNGYVDLKPWY